VDNPPDLAERLLDYSARIVKVAQALPRTLTGRTLGDQLLRSGTAVGAHYEEAQGAESRDDFVHKLQIALKELRESNYWLRLLAKSGILEPERLAGLINESEQLRAILSKVVARTKGKVKPKQKLD
jgi:four helix bundle protein